MIYFRIPQFQKKRRPSYVGAGSPYLSPATLHVSQQSPLVDAPLPTILSHKPFYCLAMWVSVHILKLNFVVASINDQLDDNMPPDQADLLIHMFGAILPFGFVVLPIVALLAIEIDHLVFSSGQYRGSLVWSGTHLFSQSSLVSSASLSLRPWPRLDNWCIPPSFIKRENCLDFETMASWYVYSNIKYYYCHGME